MPVEVNVRLSHATCLSVAKLSHLPLETLTTSSATPIVMAASLPYESTESHAQSLPRARASSPDRIFHGLPYCIFRRDRATREKFVLAANPAQPTFCTENNVKLFSTAATER